MVLFLNTYVFNHRDCYMSVRYQEWIKWSLVDIYKLKKVIVALCNHNPSFVDTLPENRYQTNVLYIGAEDYKQRM